MGNKNRALVGSLMAIAFSLSACSETTDSGSVSEASLPTPGSNERAYYDDGCRAGTTDAQSSMSMAYERHAEMYDSRFEPYFKQGYEACWLQYR